MTPLEIRAQLHEEVWDVAVIGELDLMTVGDFEAAIAQLYTAPKPVELDLGGLEFCDSSGLKSLIGLRTALHANGQNIRIVRPSPQFTRLLQVAGLDSLFDT
jgi:anti-sigma B factor antagonist